MESSRYFKQLVLAYLQLVIAGYQANPVTTSYCTHEPSASELSDLFTYDTHEAFSMAGYNHVHVPNDIKHFKNVELFTISPDDETECRRRPEVSPYINVASTCSWRYVLNRDVNRRPESLIEAKCNCTPHRRCISGAVNSRCEPVKFNMPVLRKYACDVTTGTYLYKQTMERITVGCTCVITD